MNNIPDISVVIPHFNQLRQLEKCLASLERQTLERSRYEIIVADNATPGGFEHLRRAFPNVRFVEAAERGAAPARNKALAAASGDMIAFIDSDCVAAQDWLETGIEGLRDAELSGGRIIVTVEKESAPTPVEAFERVFAFRQRDYVEKKKFSATANLFARSKAARAIGSFTNGLSEDVDWCRRGVALGFRLAFNDKSIVSHPARRDWSELVRKWERIVAERWAGFEGRGLIGASAWLGLAAATALSTAPHLLRVATSAELASVRDRAAAASVLARLRWWRARRMASLLFAK
ncbi:MAG: glycosyltransferase [Parvularculaceae bacterium]|nr:glycosyltransferase [Parvularculaceae bacterium]